MEASIKEFPDAHDQNALHGTRRSPDAIEWSVVGAGPDRQEAGSMTALRVVTEPATSAGRLYPRYDQEAGILAAESAVPRLWMFGVDIDGRIIFDLDEHRVLANVDLHFPKHRWVRDLGDDAPVAAPPADLVFTPETVAYKSFSLPLRVRADRRAQRLRIELGDKRPDRAIALSESCVALLAGHELAGFVVGIG
jgi:hypothetical protein